MWSDRNPNSSNWAANEIGPNRMSELDFLPKTLLVDTAPCCPPLRLASALAGQDGGELPSLNWSVEAIPK